MNISEMREMPPTELRSEAQKIEAKIWKLRFQAKGEPIEDPGALKQLKKERARLLTVIRQKEIAAEVSGASADGSDAASSEGAGE